jgi:hypothetical protein
MSTFDNTNPYNSTLYNNTPLESEYDNEWMEMEKTLFEKRMPPYHNLNVTGSFVGIMGQDNEYDLLTKRKEDRIKRQQDYYANLAAGTMDPTKLKEAIETNENKFVDPDDRKAANILMGIYKSPYTKYGGKSKKSRKSKQSKKSNKSKKSKNARKSRKSKK